MADRLVAEDGQASPTVLTTRARRKIYAESGRIDIPDNVEEVYSGNRLREIIELKGYRIPWLAEKLGYHRTYLVRMMDGERELTRPFVVACCEFLDLPIDSIFIRHGQRDD